MEINNEQLDTLIQLNLLKENYNLLLEEEKFNLIQWFKDKLNSFVALAKSIPDKIRDMINKLKKNTSEVTEVETKEIEVAPGKKTKVSTSNFKSVCHNIMAGIANTGKNIANILQSLIKICKYAITRKNNEELQAEKKKLSSEFQQLKERFSLLNIYRRAMGAIFNKKNAETSKDEDDPRARVQKQIDRGDKAIEDMKDLNKKAKENIAKHREFIDKRKKRSEEIKNKVRKDFDDARNPKDKMEKINKNTKDFTDALEKFDKKSDDIHEERRKRNADIANQMNKLVSDSQKNKESKRNFTSKESEERFNKAKEKFEKSAKQDDFFVGQNTSSEDFDKAMRNKNTRLTFK